MKRAAWFLPVAFVLPSFAQDKTKEWSGSKAGLKAVEAMKKLKGFHLEMEVDSVLYNGKYSGLVIGDGAAVRSATEIWARKGQLLVRDRNGRIVPLNQLSANTDELRAARGFRNPADMLVEIEIACHQARQEALELETVDAVECRKVQVDLQPAQKEAVIKALFGGPGVGGVPIPNPENMLNIPETTVRYVIWMGTEDLRIRKISFEVKPVVKKGVPEGYGIPGLGAGFDPSQWTYRSSTRLFQHDEELNWSIPREVSQKLGLK